MPAGPAAKPLAISLCRCASTPLDRAEAEIYALLRDDPGAGSSVATAVRSMVAASVLRHRAEPMLRRFRPDAIYERFSLFGSAGVTLARELDLPLILEVNAPLSDEQAAHRGLAFGQTARAVERDILRAADHVIAVSRRVAGWLTESGVDPARICMLPDGVDVDRFAAGQRQRAALRAELGIDAAQPVVGFVGTLKTWHGTETLVRAVAALHRCHNGRLAPHLLVVGDGPERGNLEHLARREGIAGATTFTGSIRHDRMPAYLAAMDVAAAPYDRAPDVYFSPLKLFEYLAAGRPVVAAVIGALLVLAVLRGAFYYAQIVMTSRVGQEVVLKVRRRLFAHLQRLWLRFHGESRTGDLLTRITGDVNSLRELLVASLLSLASETVVIVGFLAVMFIMDWRLALVAVVTIPVIFTLVTVFSRRIREQARKQRRREGDLAAVAQQTLSGIHVVQLFARERVEDEKVRALKRRSLQAGLKTVRLEARLNQAVELSVAAGMALTLWLGATQVLAGQLTPGELIVFVAYMQSFYRPLRRISRVAERAAKASSCVDRITEILDQEPDIRGGAEEAPPFRGEIRFDRVGFAYADDAPALREINLSIAPGQTVALVGPSGAGKSTILALLSRLYDPTAGTVRIDGHDLRAFTLESLRNQISVVPQDGMLFAGTIRDNIAYGKPEAAEAEIVAAARQANIHDFVLGLPGAYAAMVGERGLSLSGGQRQRIALARAIVKDAPIVLLDEPTTGLDAESEGLVMEAFERVFAGRTAVVIAHRLSTVRRADQILVLEGGRVVERGAHVELLAAGGRYRDLNELQIAAEADLGPTPEPIPLRRRPA